MMRRSYLIRSSMMLLGAALVAGGCVGCAEADAKVAPITPPSPAVVDEIATYKSTGGGMNALIQGTLVRHDGCLYTGSLDHETDGSSLTLMVFPRQSTTWDGTTLTVGNESWKVGEAVYLGGGFIREPSRPYDLGSGITLPASCVVTDEVWAVSGAQ